MIKDTELRKTNLVYWHPPNGKYILMQVKEIKEQYLTASSLSGSATNLVLHYDSFDLQPIPLTPEILEACGFKKMSDGSNDYLGLATYNGIEKGILRFYDLDVKAVALFVKENMIGTNLYYLHQLQNIYYLLTGRELEIKLQIT